MEKDFRRRDTPMHLFDSLISRYSKVKDELLDFTSEFHDAMLFDISGYSQEASEDINDIDIESLRVQVTSFEAMLSSYKNIEYTYC